MLSRLQINLEKPKQSKINVNISSLLQGVLMEQISYEYATELHNGGRQPYSHFVQINQEEIIWTIQTLNQRAFDQILVPMLSSQVQTIYLRHKDLELNILDKKLEQTTYDQLRKDRYFTDGSRNQKIQFLSPTAFKSQGEYIFYPSVHFLFQSLMMKYDACSDDAGLFGQDIMEHFEQNIKIVRYKLRSYSFQLEGTKIPAFLGEIDIRINGAQALVNLADYLLAFGQYSGVGIKCGIGMGGIRVGEDRRKES
ncbi:CRISPR-associated endoribonuclease Cas6 [[Clostridium] polysaccharolyticum]|uniref:CRISPR-associated endoribonuclease Cas6 n=1 Tax=[Clostridium] polysaccharolyticum TaxID=29364 RepID=A0A1I0AV45_9FIRM|nr:CRISPR-associated endoribonuclease Cas6 [[Clostridium] polysaccharolyticum]SES98245.1 CRISPR-associated endoribonuclease Cas6 [[Clostridium] polysaccharolyticum]